MPPNFNSNFLGRPNFPGGGFLSRGAGAGANPAGTSLLSGSPGGTFGTGTAKDGARFTVKGPVPPPPTVPGAPAGGPVPSPLPRPNAVGGGVFNQTLPAQPNPLNGPQGAQLLHQLFGSAGLNLPINPNAAFAFTGQGADFRGAPLDANAGPFQGDIFSFLGKDAGTTAGLVANALLAQGIGQQGRAEESEGLLRALHEMFGQSQAAALDSRSQAKAADFVADAGSPGRRDLLTNQATRDAARFKNDASNRARDLGLFGQGGASFDPTLAIENAANRGLGDRLFQIENQLFGERGAAAQLGSSIAGQGAQNLQALVGGPTAALAGRLDRAQNLGIGPLIEFLAQIPAVQQNQAIATSGNTFFEDASPILEALIGGVSKIAAAPT